VLSQQNKAVWRLIWGYYSIINSFKVENEQTSHQPTELLICRRFSDGFRHGKKTFFRYANASFDVTIRL